ncbi:Uncharacterized protein DBV15_08159 [Temnothorax longispinosus]|uniref:Uncharacterized protein n=1 Tax=Temnothorax longispinosus TaxID=300112 RepID=A0A4S2KEW6_9HYME|nr:Uncharacterized protein DBV15_08159 [Temnothorax longispinosus]
MIQIKPREDFNLDVLLSHGLSKLVSQSVASFSPKDLSIGVSNGVGCSEGRNRTDEEEKKEFTNCKMQLSALVRGVSRSTRAVPASRVGGEASVPGFSSARHASSNGSPSVLREQNDSHLLFRAKGRRDSRVERRFAPNLPEQRSSRGPGNALGVLIKTPIKNGRAAPHRCETWRGIKRPVVQRRRAPRRRRPSLMHMEAGSRRRRKLVTIRPNKTSRDSDGDVAETVSERGVTPDQNESLVPSRHNGTATWTLRKARRQQQQATFAALTGPYVKVPKKRYGDADKTSGHALSRRYVICASAAYSRE